MRWRVSAWTHPAGASFDLIEHSLPITSGTFSDPETPNGRCQFTLPASYAWQDLISADPVTPANNRNALIRLYRDGVDNTGQPDQEFYLERFQRRINDDGTEEVVLYGRAWKLAGLDAAVVRWKDWEAGNTKTTEPDWTYGGRNIFAEAGSESVGAEPAVYQLIVDASAGTYTITDGTDISTIDWNDGASAIEVHLETDITAITDVNVTGTGTTADPFIIEFKTPGFGITLTSDDTNLTGTTTLTETQEGAWDTNGWTVAQTVSDGTPRIFGAYASNNGFAVTEEQAHTGTKSLRINPLDIDTHGRFAGGQKVLTNLTAGTYQASIWVRPTNNTAADVYVLVIRTIWGELLYLADGTPARTADSAYTPNAWTEVTLTDVVIPDGVTEIIFRFSNTAATGNPNVWYLDDEHFAKGAPASTQGTIWTELLDDAKTDHAPGLVRLPWVTQGAFTGVDDSAAVAWPRNESITLNRGKHYGTDLAASDFFNLGYVHDLRPGLGAGAGETEPDEANWYLEVWAEANRGVTHADLAFITAFGVNGGVIAGRIPKQTRILAEGADGIIVEVSDATQEGIFGVWEEWIGDPDITDTTTLLAKAQKRLDDDLNNVIAMEVELDPAAPTPYADFTVGDTAPFLAAGHVARHDRRISGITLTAESSLDGELFWTPSVVASKLLVGRHARNEALYKLLTAYQRMPEDFADNNNQPRLTGGGGAGPTVVVAASNASEFSKAIAHFHCDGVDDHVQIQEAIDALPASGGRLLLSEGDFSLGGTVTVPDRVTITGTNPSFGTYVSASGVTGAMFTVPGSATVVFEDLWVDNFGSAAAIDVDGVAWLTRVGIANFNAAGFGVDVAGRIHATDCTLGGSETDVHIASAAPFSTIVNPIHLGTANLAMLIEGDGTTIAGGSMSSASIRLDGAFGTVMSGFRVTGGFANPTIELVNASRHTVISGVEIEANSFGGIHVATGCDDLIIEATAIYDCITPLILDGDDFTVDVRIEGSTGGHAVESAGSEGKISGTIGPPGDAHNTYDAVHFDGGTELWATGLKILPVAGGVAWRYGINVAAGTRHRVVGNDFSDPGGTLYGTGRFNNAGTGTVTAWAGTHGDNID